jgi:hypothetical protein
MRFFEQEPPIDCAKERGIHLRQRFNRKSWDDDCIYRSEVNGWCGNVYAREAAGNTNYHQEKLEDGLFCFVKEKPC